MIHFSTKRELKIPIKLFFNTILSVKSYKNFVPWCKDSWETNHNIEKVNYEYLFNKFPILQENYNINIDKLEEIKLNSFDGGITVGFDIVDFSYISQVVSIEPNIVLSITDSSKSHIFSKLESLWILREEENILNVEYFINFQFKSSVFSHVTNLFLNFLGENIIKAFISHSSNNYLMWIANKKSTKLTSISEIIESKLNEINFDSINDKMSIENLMKNFYELKKIELKEIENFINIISYNKLALKKLAFLSENAVWNSKIHIEKMKEEMCKL